jgi:predicted site-specific integrase-resolvase
MKTREVVKNFGVCRATIVQWCQKNNVKRVLGKYHRLEYVLTEEDIEAFKNRRSPGRPKGNKKK